MILLLYDSTGCMCIAFWPRHSLAPSSVLWQPPTGCVLSSAQHSTTGKLHSMKHHVNESEVIFMISSTRVCPVTIDLSCAPFSVFTCGYKGQRAHFKNGCLHPQWLNVFSVMKLKHGKQHIYIFFLPATRHDHPPQLPPNRSRLIFKTNIS